MIGRILALKVTYLIGNGFDLSLGLKTSYADFIEIYGKTGCHDECIRILKDSIGKDPESWADAEVAMGRIAKRFTGETAVKDYLRCHSDFVNELSKYLDNQQRLFHAQDFESDIIEGFKEATVHLYKHLFPYRASIKNAYAKNSANDWEFQFISFNYTTTLDRCIDLFGAPGCIIHSQFENFRKHPSKISGVIHVHSITDFGMQMGVDHASQIDDSLIRSANDVKCSVVKPLANDLLNPEIVKSCSSSIERSDIICTYGMSLGETDTIWWKKIVKWLLAGESHLLVIFYYDNDYHAAVAGDYNIWSNKAKEMLLDNAEVDSNSKEYEMLKKRIYVCMNISLFGIELRNICKPS